MYKSDHVNFVPNDMGDREVLTPPNNTVAALKFSPYIVSKNFLVASSWDATIRCWEIEQNGNSIPKIMKTTGVVFGDVSWGDDGTKVFMCGYDKKVQCWDLTSEEILDIGRHESVASICTWIKTPNYTCLMTGSWDGIMKFWDLRSKNPFKIMKLSESCHSVDFVWPKAVVAGKTFVTGLTFEKEPKEEFSRYYQPFSRSKIKILKNKLRIPTYYALIHKENISLIPFSEKIGVKPLNVNYDNFCNMQDFAFHPINGTFASVRNDGRYSFCTMNKPRKMFISKKVSQDLPVCCFSDDGQLFAYARGEAYQDHCKFYKAKQNIYIHCYDEASYEKPDGNMLSLPSQHQDDIIL